MSAKIVWSNNRQLQFDQFEGSETYLLFGHLIHVWMAGHILKNI